MCGMTWSIRPRKRGRKRKRSKSNLAERLLREKASHRGLAISYCRTRETMRRKIRLSFESWKREHSLPPVPRGPLIAVLDAMWFTFRIGSVSRRFTSYLILLRPVESDMATLVSLTLQSGRESTAAWQKQLSTLSEETQQRIQAIVMDGNTGMIRIAKERGWHLQWCHSHIKRKVWELRGVRKLPAREMRHTITRLVYRFLETPSDEEAQQCVEQLRSLFARSDCPLSFPKRLSGVVRRSAVLRTYRYVPELNLPVTTNSAEQVHSHIRERWSAWRGTRTPEALAYWLDIFQRDIRHVHCRGFHETLQNKNHHRISGS